MTRERLCDHGSSTAEWDAIVIGAGPAGALVSRRLAQAGARVLLVDKKAFPRFKVCGACLNHDALAVLRAEGLGSLVDEMGGLPLTGFHVGLERRIVRFELPQGRALARETFDAALVHEAVLAGARFLPQTAASVLAGVALAPARRVSLTRHGEIEAASASVVIVAAGLGHRALDLVPGIRTHVRSDARIGAGCTISAFPGAYTEGIIHMAVAPAGYVGLVRVQEGRLTVGAAFDRSFLRQAGTPAQATAAVLDRAGFPPIPALDQAAWYGTVGLTRRTRPVALHRLFLVGDATGYVEPFTGQGMACALASARAVAPLALRGIQSWSGSLERAWSARHRALFGRRLWLCHGLARAARRPLVTRALFAVATGAPSLFGLMIDHVSASRTVVETTPICP
jgi:flavin-dependent dehydrogenase